MPIIQLKPEHQHTKKKQSLVIGINSQKGKQINAQLQKQPSKNIKVQQQQKKQQPHLIIKQPIKNSEQKQKQKAVNKHENKNTKRQNQTNKKTQNQKTLNVQIVKKDSIINEPTKNINKNSVVQAKLSQPAGIIQSQKQQKKSKKKKKKNLPLQQQSVSPEIKLSNRTKQLYLNFISKHKIEPSYQYPEFMQILKQSFTQYALKQLNYEMKINQNAQEKSIVAQDFNPVHVHNQYLFDYLTKRKKFHQDRIYFGVLEQNRSFSDLIWREQIQSQPKKQQVASLFNDIHLVVINDVWEGQYQIKNKQKPSKDDIIYGSYKANQIRLAESIIKDKLNSLNDDFIIPTQQNLYQGQKQIHQPFNMHKKYDINSQQTKKAEQFVKKLQQQQRQAKQRLCKQRQLQEQQQIRRLQEQKQLQHQLKQQKMRQRRAKIQQKALQRQRQKQQQQQQHSKYLQYINHHKQKVPLFKKNQQDFKAFMIKQHFRKLQAMKQYQKSKRSISKDQIQIHQDKYRELKELLEEERREMLKLQQQKWQQTNPLYYRSKFHTSIQNQMYAATVDQEKKSKAQQLYTKKIQYSTIVKSKFVPKIDIKKKQELQRLIMDLAPKAKDDKLLAQKIKIQGQRNLQKLHRLVGQLRAKGKVRKHQTPPVDLQLSTKRPRYVNYLQDLKTSRMGNSSSMRNSRFNSLDVSKMNRNSVGLIQMKARNLQQHADRKSLYLKNAKHMDIEDYLPKKFQLQDDYIQSAKAKLKVIKKYEWQDEDENKDKDDIKSNNTSKKQL